MPKFDVNAQVTSRLKFKPIAQFKNLCLGYLQSVTVTTSEEVADGSKGYEYGGLKIPMLTMEFIEWKENPQDEDRYYTPRWTPIVSKANTGLPIEKKTLDNLYQSMWFQLKHIVDAYGGKMDKVPEIDENAAPEERIKQFTAFFSYIATYFNTGLAGKPIFKSADNASYLMAMKLIADYQTGKFLAFPTFVGEGFIERAIMVQDNTTKKVVLKTTLEIKPQESVELRVKSTSTSVPGSGDSPTALPDDVMKKLGITG